MLTVNPFKRITATEALKHPWIYVRKIYNKINDSFCFRSPYNLITIAIFFYLNF